MTDQTKPVPVDSARVLAALGVLGWPDDRDVAGRDPESPSYLPPGTTWELVEDVIRAADEAADPETRHVIEFRADGWTLKHPLACRPDLFACPLNQVAEEMSGPLAAPGRYEVELNDLGDRLCILDRIDLPEADR